MRVLVLQHIECEPPGAYEEVLRERKALLTRVELDQGDRLPDWRDFDAIVAMGGPMSANDDETLPWLTREKRLIREAVQAGVAFWGSCLGAQLLAASLGGRVYAGSRPEVGLMPVRLTRLAATDPVFAGLPPELLTFQWHGDTFELPPGGELLASSDAYPAQAFRWKSRAYGIQFHLEVTPELARQWGEVPEYREALEKVLGPGALNDVVADLERHAQQLISRGKAMFARWLNLVVPRRP